MELLGALLSKTALHTVSPAGCNDIFNFDIFNFDPDDHNHACMARRLFDRVSHGLHVSRSTASAYAVHKSRKAAPSAALSSPVPVEVMAAAAVDVKSATAESMVSVLRDGME